MIALARGGINTDKRTNFAVQLAGAGPAELKTAATLAVATSERILGAAVAELLDRMPARQRVVSPAELAERLIGDDVRQARAGIAAVRQMQQRAMNADREFASGRPNATARFSQALAERDPAKIAGEPVEAASRTAAIADCCARNAATSGPLTALYVAPNPICRRPLRYRPIRAFDNR